MSVAKKVRKNILGAGYYSIGSIRTGSKNGAENSRKVYKVKCTHCINIVARVFFFLLV